MKTSNTISVVVDVDTADMRLDKFLAQLPEIPTRNFAKNLIDNGHVTVDAKPAKASIVLRVGQRVELSLPEITPSELVPYSLPLDICFEDDDIIVVNKPSGLVVHPAAGHEQDTLVNALLAHTKNLSMKNEQRPGIVHRIDKETSGLLVIAKNDFAHDRLAAQFKDKSTHRIYYALADGQLPRQEGTSRSYLARHPTDRKRFASLRENNRVIADYRGELDVGKWAVTHYSKIAQSKNMSFLKIRLETGRTHQIRVHMSELGHPLVGDLLYGYSQKKYKELRLNRFFLHAAELGFNHPRSHESLLFKVPWPPPEQEKLREFGFDHALV